MAESTDESVARAVEHHLAGRFAEAEPIYRQIIDLHPQHGNALQLLGTLCYQTGRHEEAVDLLSRAIALDDSQAAFHSNLGNALRALGRLDESEAAGRRAVELQADYAEAHNNLGVTLQEQQRLAEAANCFLRSVRLKPDYAEAYCNLGLVMRLQGEHRKAISSYVRALRFKPDYAEAHYGLARSLKEVGRITEALVSYEECLRIQPDYAEAYNNRGAALLGQGRISEGIASFEEAIRHKPDLADAHLNLGIALLQVGYLERGWQEYEWRKKAKNAGPRVYAQPEWQGEPLAGKTVLAHAEQGLGDTIQLVRYAPLIKEQGARVIVECAAVLIPLLRSCQAIDDFLPAGQPPPRFDVQIPMMSFPARFRTTLTTIPAQVPYLFPEPARVDKWRQELSTVRAFKIGIAWQGNPALSDDHLRSIPLRHFAPLADLPGVQIYSLQKGPGTEQLANEGWPCIDLGSRLDPPGEAFLDTAAVMTHLDLVISADTAIAHLAGALGVPVWLALMYAPDWRWLLERSDTPWYPTMRLFRQPLPGDWPDVLSAMARALTAIVKTRTATSGV